MISVRIDVRRRLDLEPMLMAGLAGGLAEVVWVALYSMLTPLTAAEVLRGIVASFAPALADATLAPALGLAIHFGLAALVGVVFGLALWRPLLRRHGRQARWIVALAVLGAIWAVNFLVLLPRLNPEFVTLMPPLVTLASKLLFALAMARALEAQAQPR